MTSTWRDRAVRPEEAVQLLRTGHRVFLHGGSAVAAPLEAALARRALDLDHLEIYQLHKEGPEPLVAPALAAHVRVHALFCGANIRSAIAEGRADYIPVFLSDIPHYMREGVFPIDVAIVHLSPPDAHGYCSLGVSVDIAKQAFDSARLVIAEINQRMPRTHGPAFVRLEDLDAFILTDRPLPTRAREAVSPALEAIGRYVAELVPDEATLQLGIGAIPDAVAAALGTKRDLGVHTEMFSDGVVDLIKAGVVTNEAKSIHPGSCVTSFVMGSQALYDFVDDNPGVHFHPVDFTNDTAVIRQHRRMIAINSALEIDLSGQVCADSIGFRIYSGIGGQMDFIRGAALAPEGKAIIALPATAQGGAVSRIVPALAPGAGVVTTRGHVQFVVTEYGVADLRGRSLAQRAEALIAIAHPDHREALRRHAAGRHGFASGSSRPSSFTAGNPAVEPSSNA